jgi:Zn-dependent alcohol dehydrogenase
MCLLGTFARHTVVPVKSVVKIDEGFPLHLAALVGCGVTTGFGSAVRTAELRAGDTAVVIGIGGIGINAVQGATIAGCRYVVAVDPVEFKRDKALELGATRVAPSMDEAWKQVRGALFGSSNGQHDVPRLLEMYNLGLLKLDELITREYALEEINQGYQDMRQGRNIRGLIRF